MIQVERIKAIMKAHGLTVNSFARLVNVTSSKISKVVSGEQSLSADSVGILIKEYQISPNWLFGYEGDPNSVQYLGDMVHTSELEKLKLEKQQLRDELGDVYKQLSEALRGK